MRQRRHVWTRGFNGGTCACGCRVVQRERPHAWLPGKTVWVEVYISPSGVETERRVPPCEPRSKPCP